MWPLKGNPPCPSPGSLNPQRTHRWRVNLKISRVLKPLPRNITIQAEMWSYSRVFHLIKRNHWKQANAKAFLNGSPSRASVHFLGHAYLKPLPVGLHLEDDTGVRFGKRISVRNAFACHTQLNFGQAGAVKDSQCISSWLVNVAHLLHSVLGRKRGKKRHTNHHGICQRRKPSNHLPGYCSTNNFKSCMYFLFHFPLQWHSARETNKQNQRNNKKPQQVLVCLAKKAIFLYDLHIFA